MKVFGETVAAILYYVAIICYMVTLFTIVMVFSGDVSYSIAVVLTISAPFGVWWLEIKDLENDRIARILVHILSFFSVFLFLAIGIAVIYFLGRSARPLSVFSVAVYFVLLVLPTLKYYRLIMKRYHWLNISNRIFCKNTTLYLTDIETEHEKKVRKQWLITFFISTAISTLHMCIGSQGVKEFVKDMAWPVSFFLGLAILCSAIGACVTYHCSYKSKGTILLGCNIIAFPLVGLANFAKGEWSQIAWPIIIFFIIVNVIFWVNCLRLYSINVSREYRKSLALKEG